MIQLVDHLFILLLFVVQPLVGAWSYRRYVARVEAGEPSNRIRLYRQDLILEWVALGVLAIAWYLLGRPVAALGFVAPGGTGFWIGAGVLVLVTAYLITQWRSTASMSDEQKAKHKESFGNLVHFMPQTDRDYRHFVGLSITAGIVEEILYRGFVFWYLLMLMPVWAAIIVSAVVFGLAHSYQGAAGVARVTLVGIAFGIFYVVTGSIWLPMLAHAVLDILQGASVVRIMRGDDDAAAAAVPRAASAA
ncbi:MAG: CPBP family intramembrane metalloprotease [Gammaproteobacteria bacterium]|nr:CPBP family intramembrane metalloprotease [Gammaproteobacteria bacterium]MDH3430787.1 CPBP family intramembrane metalloprotease [Gammaproteobacteria bacterium]MDH3432563.1 CPBP family intramembrane metalloprotease [Gammaproteobacteria bacterium]